MCVEGGEYSWFIVQCSMMGCFLGAAWSADVPTLRNLTAIPLETLSWAPVEWEYIWLGRKVAWIGKYVGLAVEELQYAYVAGAG